MNAASTVQQNVVNTNAQIHNLGQALMNRMYFFQKDAGRYLAQGRPMTTAYANQYTKLYRAHHALAVISEAAATYYWNAAIENTREQFIQQNLGQTLEISSTITFTQHKVEDFIGETNDLTDAFADWNLAEDIYDGTDYHALMEEGKEAQGSTRRKQIPGPPQIYQYYDENGNITKSIAIYPSVISKSSHFQWNTTIEQHEQWLLQTVEEALDNGWMLLSKNPALRKLDRMAVAATLMLPLIEPDEDGPWSIDFSHKELMKDILAEERQFTDNFISDSYRARRACAWLHHRGINLPETRNHNDLKVFRKHMKEAQAHFQNIHPDPDQGIKDWATTTLTGIQLDVKRPETPLLEWIPARPDNQGIRHNQRMQRIATKGIGTSDHIQVLFQMDTETFYAHLRLRTHRFPKSKLEAIMSPTSYKPGENGIRKIEADSSIDSFIRAICIARWHDEAHNTNYFKIASAALKDRYEFADTVIELAGYALQAEPVTRTSASDEFYKNCFWKEMKIMQKRGWGPYYRPAQK